MTTTYDEAHEPFGRCVLCGATLDEPGDRCVGPCANSPYERDEPTPDEWEAHEREMDERQARHDAWADEVYG